MNKDSSVPFSIYKKTAEGRMINSRIHRSSMEIFQVVAGRIVAQIGTDTVRAESGDILFIPPDMMFRVESEDGPASVRGITFSNSIIEQNMDKFDTEVFDMFYIQSKSRAIVFDSAHAVQLQLSALISTCCEEYSTRDVCYKLPIRANIYLIMATLLRFYCGSKNELDRMIYHNVLRLRPVMNYISEYFKDKIYVDDLAEMINVSPDYFTKMFKESIGKTPIDYINALRVNYSMDLLTNTEMSMSEIADIIGFCNPNYFHKIFKQYMGTSPLGYRKSTK